MGVAVSASFIVYSVACSELEQEANGRLMETAALLAESVQLQFNAELRKFEHWAAMPLVAQTALDYNNPKLLSAFDEYFSGVVSKEPYSSIYLISLEGDCVASDDPRRVHHPHCKKVVSKLPTAQAGFSGTANIGHSKLSVATGRPIVSLTAPVFYQGRVVAILRSSVDMARISLEHLALLNLEHKKKAYLFDPSLPLSLPKEHQLHTPTSRARYIPPPAALRLAFENRSESIFRFWEDDREYLAAAAQMRKPSWTFFVTQPMDQILAPIKFLKKAVAIVVAMTLGLLAASVFLLTAPVVRGIERCREFSADIRRGDLTKRLQPQSRDEVGGLAMDLNSMAAQLQSNHQALEDAERKYRGIFENAMEGIFQTDEVGNILAANPKLAALLGASSMDEITGMGVHNFYEDLTQRAEFLARLRADGEVSGFSCEIKRLDGARRQVLLHARAQRNAGGKISVIDGITEDVTELRIAEARARRTREAEDLLLRTELEMLRYQVNPHFLFNTLNSIRELVLTDPGDGVQMIEALAAFYHACLVKRSEPLFTVDEEFARIDRYLQIQKVRFGQKLEVEVQINGNAGSVSIPAFIVQPLVENAVKYGQKSGANPLQIQISASIEDDCCVVKVVNTGRWFQPDRADKDSGTQLGLEYVQRSLSHHYGQSAKLATKEQDGWVAIEANFPVQGSA